MDNVKLKWKIIIYPSPLPTASQQTKWTYQQHTTSGALSNIVTYIYLYIFVYNHCSKLSVNHIVFATCPANIHFSFRIKSVSLTLPCNLSPVNPLMLINGGLLCTWHSVDEASTWNATISEIPPKPLHNRVVRVFLFHLTGLSFPYTIRIMALFYYMETYISRLWIWYLI